jgi:hypothetical protein
VNGEGKRSEGKGKNSEVLVVRRFKKENMRRKREVFEGEKSDAKKD